MNEWMNELNKIINKLMSERKKEWMNWTKL